MCLTNPEAEQNAELERELADTHLRKQFQPGVITGFCEYCGYATLAAVLRDYSVDDTRAMLEEYMRQSKPLSDDEQLAALGSAP